jgi:hypothetical protein
LKTLKDLPDLFNCKKKTSETISPKNLKKALLTTITGNQSPKTLKIHAPTANLNPEHGVSSKEATGRTTEKFSLPGFFTFEKKSPLLYHCR